MEGELQVSQQREPVSTIPEVPEISPEQIELTENQTEKNPILQDNGKSQDLEPSNIPLQNLLEEIAVNSGNQGTVYADPKDLGLEILNKDEYGFYLNIPSEIIKQIQEAQKEFVPLFLRIHQNYQQYEEWKYLNESNPFVFSPTTIKVMSEEVLPKLMNEVTVLVSNGANLDTNPERSIHWEESDIQGILNKLLAYESYRLERVMAPRARDYLASAFPSEPKLRVKELCTGAGITTALMYEALKETGKGVEFHTVDNSLQSVMCAATLLTIRGIPTRIVLDSDAKEKDFDGVTIYFEPALESMKKEGQYHFVFSDNGINYFDEQSHYEVLEEMLGKIKPGGLFQDCTLDPSIQIDLSTPSMFKAIFSSKRQAKLGDDEYALKQKDGVQLIKQLFSPSSTMQYELLNEVRKKLGFGLFWEYLMGAKKAAGITQKLAPKIAQDLRKTGLKVQEATGMQGEYYPSYEKQVHSLTRFYELKLPSINDTQ